MASRIVVHFRDGSKVTYPDPKISVIARDWSAVFGDGIVTIKDPYGKKVTLPLDLISVVEEEPEPRW